MFPSGTPQWMGIMVAVSSFDITRCRITAWLLTAQIHRGPINSALQHEVMHNTFTVTNGVAQAFAVLFRGGTGVVFDNTLNAQGNGGYNNVLGLVVLPRIGRRRRRMSARQVLSARLRRNSAAGQRLHGSRTRPALSNEPWGSVPVYDWGNHVNAPIVV